jgi:hypothetical protein
MVNEIATTKELKRQNDKLAKLISAPFKNFEEGLEPYQHIHSIAMSENCLFETLAKQIYGDDT